MTRFRLPSSAREGQSPPSPWPWPCPSWPGLCSFGGAGECGLGGFGCTFGAWVDGVALLAVGAGRGACLVAVGAFVVDPDAGRLVGALAVARSAPTSRTA